MSRPSSRRSQELPFRFSDYVRDVGWANYRQGMAELAEFPPAVLIVDWSHLIEDRLDRIGVSIEDFRTTLTGGWLFGYVEALKRVGVRAVVACVSARVTVPRRFPHEPTGALVAILPATDAYRAARRRVVNPYGETLEEAVGPVRGPARLWSAVLRELAPWMATPVQALASEVAREGCRAILCQGYEHPRFDQCVRLGRRLKIPVFGGSQGGDAPRRWLEARARRRSLRDAAGIIAGASREAERVRAGYGVRDEALAQLATPLDLDAWHPSPSAEREAARDALGIPPGARVVAWHGRVELRGKGLDLLVDAWRRVVDGRGAVASDAVPARLLLVGTGADAGALRRLIAERDLEASVVWLDRYVGDRALLRRHLAAADVYVLPSRREGFPVAPMEAMACGLPVVAANAPGVEDILEGGQRSGGVIVPRDDAEALAGALRQLVDDPTLSLQLGRRARARARATFSLDAVGAQLKEFMISRGARLS